MLVAQGDLQRLLRYSKLSLVGCSFAINLVPPPPHLRIVRSSAGPSTSSAYTPKRAQEVLAHLHKTPSNRHVKCISSAARASCASRRPPSRSPPPSAKDFCSMNALLWAKYSGIFGVTRTLPFYLLAPKLLMASANSGELTHYTQKASCARY